MTQFSIIKTGGKQYKVTPGQKIKVEKLDAEEGDKVSFENVLMTVNGEDVKVGTPNVPGARVEAKVLRQARERKKIVFKYHSKTRYRRKKGHRQYFTELEIIGM